MIIGRTHEVDGHFVGTRFAFLLVPTESVYVAQRAKGVDGDGLRIPIDWRSVALGCGRVWLPAFAVLLPLGLALSGRIHPLSWVASAIFIGLSVVAYRSGHLPDYEKARLRLLGTVTGLRIDPARLRPETRQVKLDSLSELMEKGGIPLGAETLIAILDEIPVPALPLIYGYARYAGDDAAWRECAELLYQRYQQSEM
jgi:hypothetical protein